MDTSLEISPYIKKLKQHKVKKTLPRLEVIKILLEARSAISAGDIEQASSLAGNNITLNAVYNVLKTLQLCEIVNCSKINNSRALYTLVKPEGIQP